jgi:acetyl-CoA C-acetyltransferase
MREAVIVSTARTGLAKSWRGSLNMTHGATMGGQVVKAALERAGIEAAEVEDVIMGSADPEGATGNNIARQIALRAGMPVTVSGLTVNRFCSSGLQTIALASQRIMAGEGDVYVAGGVESISLVQNDKNTKDAIDPWLKDNKPEIYWPRLQTAEYVSKKYNIPREVQDRYGVASQLRAAKAEEAAEAAKWLAGDEEAEGWNVGLAARQEAKWVSSQAYADGGDQICYNCSGYVESCGCDHGIFSRGRRSWPFWPLRM